MIFIRTNQFKYIDFLFSSRNKLNATNMIRFIILLFCIGIILCDAEPGDGIFEDIFNNISSEYA